MRVWRLSTSRSYFTANRWREAEAPRLKCRRWDYKEIEHEIGRFMSRGGGKGTHVRIYQEE